MRRAGLSGKKILVTAGPTWVALDGVRVISNISTGAMGFFLSQKASELGARVDLFLGPVGHAPVLRGVKISRYKFFDDLRGLIASRLKKKTYDIILHAAAVSDYRTVPRKGKIKSDKKSLVIRLKRTPKLIDTLRRLNPKATLVMFKLENAVSDRLLMDRARRAMKKSKADLVVANHFRKGGYQGFILDKNRLLARSSSRERLARDLMRVLERVSA